MAPTEDSQAPAGENAPVWQAAAEKAPGQDAAAPAPEDEDAAEMPAIPAPVPETVPAATAAAVAPSAEEAAPPAIPPTVMPNTEIVTVDVRFERVARVKNQPVGILQVEVEETLGHYAEWAGVRTQQIRRLNGLRYGRTLRLHQKIKIPLDKVDAAAFEEQRYEYHKRLQEDFFAAYRVVELEPYRVQPGDNIWTLCRDNFGVPMWLLKHYNMDVDLAALQIQQKVMIPVIQETAAGEPGTVSDETDLEEGAAGTPSDDPA